MPIEKQNWELEFDSLSDYRFGNEQNRKEIRWFIEKHIKNLLLEREKELWQKMKNFKIANGNYNCGEEGCCSKNPNDIREEWEIEEQASYNMAIDDCQSLLDIDEK